MYKKKCYLSYLKHLMPVYFFVNQQKLRKKIVFYIIKLALHTKYK